MLQRKSTFFRARAKAKRVRDLTRAKESIRATMVTKVRARAKAMILARAGVPARDTKRVNRRAMAMLHNRNPSLTPTLVRSV